MPCGEPITRGEGRLCLRLGSIMILTQSVDFLRKPQNTALRDRDSYNIAHYVGKNGRQAIRHDSRRVEAVRMSDMQARASFRHRSP
eukprot:6523489-Pyramimonas_sp.AAC.1